MPAVKQAITNMYIRRECQPRSTEIKVENINVHFSRVKRVGGVIVHIRNIQGHMK